MPTQRLQKLLARAGVASRRKAEEFIRQGRVTVNGAIATIGESADPRIDWIKLDGKRVTPPKQHTYLLLNKPRGYVTTVSDPKGRGTVLDLIAPRHRKALVPVGRLDYNTEGLLLLTDDGDFAQRVAHPRHGCTKIYAVKVRGYPAARAVERLRDGMVIDGRKMATAQVRLRKAPHGGEGNSWWTVSLQEGRTRQIRQMFQRVGHPVQKLRRVAVGGISDKQLKPGSYRRLTQGEVRRLSGEGSVAKSKKGKR